MLNLSASPQSFVGVAAPWDHLGRALKPYGLAIGLTLLVLVQAAPTYEVCFVAAHVLLLVYARRRVPMLLACRTPEL